MKYVPGEKRGQGELVLKDHPLHPQEWSVERSKKSSKGSRRPAWINKEFLTQLRHKKEMHRRRKQDQVTQTMQGCRDSKV